MTDNKQNLSTGLIQIYLLSDDSIFEKEGLDYQQNS